MQTTDGLGTTGEAGQLQANHVKPITLIGLQAGEILCTIHEWSEIRVVRVADGLIHARIWFCQTKDWSHGTYEFRLDEIAGRPTPARLRRMHAEGAFARGEVPAEIQEGC